MQGMVTGHGREEQMFRDWLSLGIAAYDEYPDIYNFVAGRIWEQAVPPRNYYFKSGAHWQGSAYGAGRFGCDLFCNLIFYRMTGGTFHIFTEDMEKAAKLLGDANGCSVLLKGGHGTEDADDLLYEVVCP